MENFDQQDPQAGKIVDKLVSGMDRETSRQMDELANATSTGFAQYLVESEERTNQIYSHTVKLLVLISAIATGIIIGVMTYIFRDMFNTLGGEPADIVSQVADDYLDLDLDLDINLKPGDETSLLASVANMRKQLAEIIAEARSSADALSSASEEVNATA